MAPWVPAFTSSITRESDHLKFIYFSFANIDANGLPHVRNVVFRNFLFDDKSTNVLVFVTDGRMQKFNQLLNNDKFEACFYFHHSRRQFRFNGFAKIIDLKNQIYPNVAVLSHDNIKLDSKSNNKNIHKNAINNNNINNNNNNNNNNNSDSDINKNTIKNDNIDSKINPPFVYLLYSPSVPSVPPTIDEWKKEHLQRWENLSLKLKSSFNKPFPRSSLTNEKRKLLDSISRGVDGNDINDGYNDNFKVICLFINEVDYLNEENERRVIYTRLNFDQWQEEEVCP
ncbi:uncharacterized protein ASCRUDRAFT_31642 [Ascoidea rubescens DSM 1968]|uniref:Pyridoxamine 5'-phosphate oxidase Alr4036 family FMN-binding domain-containing protein n=1 Tax=Ascoidea rubescens DSM 1968 TaxID=1344418 RepID=A0A1D2VMQ1_9ASCO|nr:hypothetical protein ASCRUDRAFT_31642 [Ascoidea rubescens DSM 1968]ODV62883.1 hypothetical protein ASCRUDRAFT_31642 [Ascoidea rubescens DSM 1968]